jgi:BASS family bile acid:Na+ symporter
MAAMLMNLMGITLVVFMVGSLLEAGLRLEIAEAAKAMRNVRFVVLSLLCCFVIGPLLAIGLTKVIPLEAPWALGMVILGLVPASPAGPVFVGIARGSLEYLTAFFLLAFAGTVITMPFLAPLVATGFNPDAWTIAKPLLYYITLPLLFGVVVRSNSTSLAAKAAPLIKRVTAIDTVLLVVLAGWNYRTQLLTAFGSYAIATQILYYAVGGALAYGLGSLLTLEYEAKAVLAIGIATRNAGPAIAMLMADPDTDPRAMAMCIIACFIGAIASGFAWGFALRRFCAPPLEPAEVAMRQT